MTTTEVRPVAVSESIKPGWRKSSWPGVAVAAGVLAAGGLVPLLVADRYLMGLLVEAVILALLALSIGFLARHLGVVSLGHTAFYGTAGYFVAIATTKWGWAPMSAVLGGIAAGVLLSVLMGLLVVRATGMSFLMLTLAFGQAVYQLCVQTSSRPLTGAHDGLLVTLDADRTVVGLTGRDLMQPHSFWMVGWAVLVLSVLAVWVVGRSRLGTLLEGIRENEERMRFSGFDTFGPRLLAFVMSGLIASVAGVLYALHISHVSPSMLSFLKAGDALIATLIGGSALLLGPVVGAFLYIWAQAHLNTSGNLHLYMGVVLVVVVMFLPGGLTGGARDLWSAVRRGLSRKEQR